MTKSITYVGLDGQKGMIAAALADAGLRGEVREHGNVADTPVALKALAVKLPACLHNPYIQCVPAKFMRNHK
jgi:transposase